MKEGYKITSQNNALNIVSEWFEESKIKKWPKECIESKLVGR